MKYFIPLLIVIVACWSCSDSSSDGSADPTPTNLENEFDAVLNNGGVPPPATRSEETIDEKEENEIIEGEVWKCRTRTVNALTPGGGNSGFPLFNPNASVIYPGSLLQGNSLKQATPNVIAVERAGGTISYDLNNGNLASSFTVEEVAKSSIQNAMNNIIANAPQNLPANFVFNYEQVQSESALAFELGIDFENAFAEVSGDFGFSSGSSLNRILVKLNQSFYTMSFDIPTSNAGIFAESVSPEDLSRYVQEGNPATYISDVTYGRIYYMLIESTSSYQEMETEIQGSFSGVTNQTDVDISANSLDKLENLKIKVMAFGGDAQTSLLTVGVTDLNQLVQLLAESTTIQTGLPISYVVRSVLTNQIVSTQLATEYDITECEPAPLGGEPPYTAHWAGNVLDRMGPVGAAYAYQDTEFVLISKDGKQFMRSNIGELEGPFSVNELADGDRPFDIGAACNIDGNDDAAPWIMTMDVTGSQYAYIRFDGRWSSNGAQPISKLADGFNPFSLNGIGAMAFRFKSSEGPANRYMINSDGTQFSLYQNNPNSFGNVTSITNWADGSLPFEQQKVGAAIGFYLGQKRFYLLFNLEGTEYAISGDVFGTGENTFIGPFDL
ncbi:thiol-activated cytolysin family protein [Persicobacter sp. CCB-QB2]|uniref:thiol-activated cytolysin family protein n=1 Tax=Persicobacter sp. CCB-QB2 TaxID=1561025 RepID=UPI0006A9F363|nr:thiol-activated cytolysin family protein [Persicobacter sp. CCB-QB2]